MSKKLRRTFFYVFLGIFIILAGSIVLYAQGYGFSWQKKSLVATGAFYFKSQPKEANIVINHKFQGKTNKVIKRLLPKEYEIEITKPGYHSWEKILEIKPKLVTAAKNILLIKKEPEINVISNNIDYFSVSPNQKNLVYLTKKTPSHSVLKLINLVDYTEKQIYPPLENGSSLLELRNISRISWANDNKKILLIFPDNRYYLLQLSSQSPLAAWTQEDSVKIINIKELVRTLSGYAIYNIHNLRFHPQDSNKLYFQNNKQLYALNTSENSLDLVASEISAFNVYENNIIYTRSLGAYKTNLEGSSLGKLFEIPFSQSQQEFEIISDNLLTINDHLYFFDPQTEILEKIVEQVKAVKFSEYNRIFSWQNEHEIGLIWLEKNYQNPIREKYETETIFKTNQDIQQSLWYTKTNQHIIFYLHNEIKIIELDDRDHRNTAVIASLEEVKNLTYNQWNDKLYGLNNEQLFEIEIGN